MVKRKDFTKKLSLGAATALTLSSPAIINAEEKAKLPNMILMMSDDHGSGQVGYAGHPYIKTPALDEMARTGVRFDNFYSAHSVCSPTRAGFMTGRHPHRSGSLWWTFSTRPEEITIGHMLQKAGYNTGHYGKWHMGSVKKESPLTPQKMGFDDTLTHDNYFDNDPELSRNGEPPVVFKGQNSEVLVAAALEFIDKVKDNGKPFGIVIWFADPHGKYLPLQKDLDLYKDVPGIEGGLKGKKGYYAEITGMDRAIGKLRTGLKERAVEENTLLWFCGDNGRASSDPHDPSTYSGIKAKLSEGGTRVPGVLVWPAKIKKPMTVSMPCSILDIFPTVMDIIGEEYVDERPIDGISLKPLFEGKMQKRSKPIPFWEFPWQITAPTVKVQFESYFADETATKGYTENFNNYDLRGFNPEEFFAKYRKDYGDKLDKKGRKMKVPKTAGNLCLVDGNYRLDISSDWTRPRLMDLTTYKKIENPEVVEKMTAYLKEWRKSVENSWSGNDYKQENTSPTE